MSTTGGKGEPAVKVEGLEPEVCVSSAKVQAPTSTSNDALLAISLAENKISASTIALAKTTEKKTITKSSIKVCSAVSHSQYSRELIRTQSTARDMIDDILNSLAEVESHMYDFREYIKAQKDEDKPLYKWATYAGYAALNAAVQQLDAASAKFKRVRLPQEFVSSSVSRANESSTSVSKAAAYALAAMNKKTANYMEEMEPSTLSDEAKAQANAIITQELQKLMEHSTRATERVWVATDLLRTLKEKRSSYADWAWSVVGTVMTAGTAAVVAMLAAHLYGPAGFNIIPLGGHGGYMYNQVIDLVERTQVVTNITGELYTIKLQDIDEHYKDLAALSESHGERIDGIVEALGPPNDEGLYYISTPNKIHGESGKDANGRIHKASDEASRQMQRLQEEMHAMRKNVNRMDIRLTKGIEKCRKD